MLIPVLTERWNLDSKTSVAPVTVARRAIQTSARWLRDQIVAGK